MKLYRCLLFVVGCAVVAAGCATKPQETPAAQPGNLKPESAHVSGEQASDAASAGLEYTVPPGWITETPASSNRKAQYRLPRVPGDAEDGEVVVYYFQGGGGTAQANVDRWIGQFSLPDGRSAAGAAKTESLRVGGIPITRVDVSGNYSGSMMPMQKAVPKAQFRMLAAIAEAGNGPWFFKLTGPEKTVARWESSFKSLLNSIKQAR